MVLGEVGEPFADQGMNLAPSPEQALPTTMWPCRLTTKLSVGVVV